MLIKQNQACKEKLIFRFEDLCITGYSLVSYSIQSGRVHSNAYIVLSFAYFIFLSV